MLRILLILLLFTSCTFSQPEESPLSEDEIILIAQSHLEQRNLDWGEVTGVTRISDNWYRINFEPENGQERYIMVS